MEAYCTPLAQAIRVAVVAPTFRDGPFQTIFRALAADYSFCGTLTDSYSLVANPLPSLKLDQYSYWACHHCITAYTASGTTGNFLRRADLVRVGFSMVTIHFL